MINEYFDGELDKKSEVSLFVLLSQNDDAREYFKSLNVLETTVNETLEEFPIELEERILKSIAKKPVKSGFFSNIKILPAIPYAKVSSYQEKVDNLSKQMMFQSRTIHLLYNSLPGVEVQAAFDNEIIVKPKI
jgi:hypothetical protein